MINVGNPSWEVLDWAIYVIWPDIMLPKSRDLVNLLPPIIFFPLCILLFARILQYIVSFSVLLLVASGDDCLAFFLGVLLSVGPKGFDGPFSHLLS